MNARYTVNLQDAEGVKATATAYASISGSATATQLAADLATFATNVAALSSAKVIGMEMSIINTASPIGVTPGDFADSNVSDVVNITFPVGSTGKVWTLVVPSVKDALVVAGGLDTTAGAYTGIAAELGAAGTYATFTDPLWIALGEPVKTFLSTREHRKRLRALSTRLISS